MTSPRGENPPTSITCEERMPDQRLISLLRRAETAADHLARSRRMDTSEVRSLIREALRAAEGLSRGLPCERPGCLNTVLYEGRGRPPRFCTDGCRGWNARRVKQQRREVEE